MDQSSVLLQSYYKIKELYENSVKDDEITIFQVISKELDFIRNITCSDPYEANLKGLIFQYVGNQDKEVSKASKSDLIFEAINSFQYAIQLREEQFSSLSIQEIYLNLGNARNMLFSPDMEKESKEQALLSQIDYNKALLSKNQDIIHKVYVGTSYANYIIGKYQQGIEEASKAIEYFTKYNDPNILATVFNNRGLIFLKLGLEDSNYYQKAIDDFHQALYFMPNFIEAKNNLASIEFVITNNKLSDGKLEEVERDISQLLDNDEKNILQHNLAKAYYEKDEYDQALEILDSLIKKPCNSASIILYCTIIKDQETEYSSIRDLLIKKIPESDENYSSAQNLIGCTYFSQRRFSDAILYLQKAVEKEPDEKRRKIFQKNLAVCYSESGDYEKGEKILSSI